MPEPGTVYNPFLYDGTPAQLEKFILTGVCVAGKVARQQQEKLDRFEHLLWRKTGRNASSLFDVIRCATREEVLELLKDVKMGQYTRIHAAFTGLANSGLDLNTCTRDELCAIKGIGMKTASFFLLFTRRDPGVACLDTHILAWMRENKIADNVPKSTPGGQALYLELEHAFLRYCRIHNRIPGELDFEIWLARNRGDKQKAPMDQINT